MKKSAGILLYRKKNGLEVLIAHPGGPFFAKKDNGIWSIPKGLYDDTENALEAGKREFQEEIGLPPPTGKYIELGEIKRRDGKIIKIWATEGDLDENKIVSNSFELEWPPNSGKKQNFPEIDRAVWADLPTATRKLQSAQGAFISRLADELGQKFDIPTQ